MSEDNKNLGDDLNEMLDDTKDSVKNTADKASEKASEFADDAKAAAKKAGERASEFADDAKEKASEFADDAKKAAGEFADDAKAVLSDGKNVAIIAHITLIGWVIALVMNNNNKTEMGSFYIRQMLGILIVSLLGIIPVIGLVAGLFAFVLWIMSLIGALGGNTKPVFLLGEHFQNWFKSL